MNGQEFMELEKLIRKPGPANIINNHVSIKSNTSLISYKNCSSLLL